MTKETSFILEFDELNDEQLKDLTNYLENNNIKHHVLKSNYQLLKEEDYKRALNEIRNMILKLDDETDNSIYDIDSGVRNDILDRIDKYLEKSDIDE